MRNGTVTESDENLKDAMVKIQIHSLQEGILFPSTYLKKIKVSFLKDGLSVVDATLEIINSEIISADVDFPTTVNFNGLKITKLVLPVNQ